MAATANAVEAPKAWLPQVAAGTPLAHFLPSPPTGYLDFKLWQQWFMIARILAARTLLRK